MHHWLGSAAPATERVMRRSGKPTCYAKAWLTDLLGRSCRHFLAIFVADIREEKTNWKIKLVARLPASNLSLPTPVPLAHRLAAFLFSTSFYWSKLCNNPLMCTFEPNFFPKQKLALPRLLYPDGSGIDMWFHLQNTRSIFVRPPSQLQASLHTKRNSELRKFGVANSKLT